MAQDDSSDQTRLWDEPRESGVNRRVRGEKKEKTDLSAVSVPAPDPDPGPAPDFDPGILALNNYALVP